MGSVINIYTLPPKPPAPIQLPIQTTISKTHPPSPDRYPSYTTPFPPSASPPPKILLVNITLPSTPSHSYSPAPIHPHHPDHYKRRLTQRFKFAQHTLSAHRQRACNAISTHHFHLSGFRRPSDRGRRPEGWLPQWSCVAGGRTWAEVSKIVPVGM